MNYNPELKTALDDSNMNRAPESVQGDDLQQRYQADSAALKADHNSQRELNKQIAEVNIEQDKNTLYDATEQQILKQGSHDKYIKTYNDLEETEKHR